MNEQAKADCQVLVVGAGPVGLALAGYAHRAGLAVRIERSEAGHRSTRRRSGSSTVAPPQRARPTRGIASTAGDRAPDVAFLRGATGTMVTMFELLRELRPLLLVRSVSTEEDMLIRECEQLGLRAGAIAEAEAGDLRPWALTDIHGDFARLYGSAKQLVWLIRPDGHVGLCLPRVDRSALEGYLRLLCAPSEVDEALSGAAT